jgi:hypothetical protein
MCTGPPLAGGFDDVAIFFTPGVISLLIRRGLVLQLLTSRV